MGNQYHNLEKTDEHYTPKYIFDSLRQTFDLDVAAPIDLSKSHVPAKAHYTELDDGLSKDWFGFVWCNPPFKNATAWANKFLDYNNGIGIFPNSNAYWVDRLWNSDAYIIKLPYRTFYGRPDGTEKRIMYTTYLVGVGDQAKGAMRFSKIGKVR